MSLEDDQLLFECGLLPAPHVALGWRLVELRLMYYRSDLVHPSWHADLRRSDDEYDALEASFLNAGGDRYTTDMVGADLDRASVRLAVNKYSRPKPKGYPNLRSIS